MVKKEKIQQVEQLKKLFDDNPVIGIIDLHKLPARQLQEVRKGLKEKAQIKVTKKSMLLLALKKSAREKIQELEKMIPLQPGVIFTSMDPFVLYKKINSLKSLTFAKEGDVAQGEIWVHAGPTSLLPGPAISELSKAGIVAGVEEGKIAVKRDALVAKKGEKISKNLASALRKLGIEPIQIGLRIRAIYQNGQIYSEETLGLVETFQEKLRQGFNDAISLSVGIEFPTKENLKFLFAKAIQSAKALEGRLVS